MRRLLLGAAALGAAMAWSAQAPAPAPDPMLQAMRDEIERSRKLTLSNLEAPYFIEYLIDEEESFSVTASLGGMVARRHERFRLPEVHVRVGDYKFDNTNYAGSGSSFGTRYNLERFPLEDAYPLLRREEIVAERMPPTGAQGYRPARGDFGNSPATSAPADQQGDFCGIAERPVRPGHRLSRNATAGKTGDGQTL